MKACPECGYRDPPYWRHHRWQQHIDFCHIEDLAENKHELAEKLKPNSAEAEDEYNFYRHTDKGPWIYRWSKEYGKKGYHLNFEKYRSRDPHQKKLGEACVAGDNKP